jgi:hypothetical protein
MPPDVRAQAYLAKAVYFWGIGEVLASGIFCRLSLEAHLENICRTDPRVTNRKGRGGLGVYKARLYTAGILDRRTSKFLGDVAETGNRAAHGHPVSCVKLAELLRCTRVLIGWTPTLPSEARKPEEKAAEFCSA